jgi:hypothetical protein
MKVPKNLPFYYDKTYINKKERERHLQYLTTISRNRWSQYEIHYIFLHMAHHLDLQFVDIIH